MAPLVLGKVLNVSCYSAWLMPAYRLEAFAFKDSACWGKVLTVSMLPCLIDVYLAAGCI